MTLSKKIPVFLIILFVLSCVSEPKKKYFIFTTDSKRVNITNSPGLVIVTNLSNPEAAKMSELIAENFEKKGILKIDKPVDYNTEFRGAANLFAADNLNNPYITKEGKTLIREVQSKLNSKYIFFINLKEEEPEFGGCLSTGGKNIIYGFSGILTGSSSEIIGISSFRMSLESSFNPLRDTENLFKENAIIVVDEIIKELEKR